MKCKCPNCGREFYSSGNDLKILELVKVKKMNISEIVNSLNISRPAVYHHLRRLEENGLVKISKIKEDTPKGNPTLVEGIKIKQKAK